MSLVGVINLSKSDPKTFNYKGEEIQVPPGTKTPKDLEKDLIEIPKPIEHLVKIYY